ncbi:YgaP family membrane protein [Acuticoccus kandeliae]|uniref:YgaP family membrane protein n=1 Tax=Acuticoccus kandeliae TaxID=2073160 RepID=UPI000D3E2844|nr:DUF2892 domain-containing protein [Acuticoccus kandeliae]
MVRNLGTFDRIVRVLLGLALVLAPYLTSVGDAATWIAPVFTVVGAILIFTGLIRFCPLYSLLGIRTCRIG